MRKIFLNTFLFLILVITIVTIYFSTIGIKTSKFNQFIKDKLIEIDPRINAELEEVTLILDLAGRVIKVETDNTNLYLNNNLIKLSKININIDIFSFLENTKSDIGWGHQIRSYVLHPYRMVKDNRTNFESSNPDKILDGQIDDFLESSLYKLNA